MQSGTLALAVGINMFSKWANPGLFLWLSLLFSNNIKTSTEDFSGFKLGLLEYKASTLTTRPL